MFVEFINEVWNGSNASVVITNNTDISIDGACKKVVWTNGLNESATVSFEAVTFSDYEELSFYVYYKDILTQEALFKIIIGTNEYEFSKKDILSGRWQHVLIDITSISGNIDEIEIVALQNNLVVFFDYFGVRKAAPSIDEDLVKALKSHITLDYREETVLTASAPIGSTSISFGANPYIFDTSLLEIEDKNTHVIEEVELVDLSGNLKTALNNSFDIGSEVRVKCPVRGEDYDSVENDPICGVVVFDVNVNKEDVTVKLKDSYKTKRFLGTLGVAIYLDCSSKKKLLELIREYNFKYGERFQILLDGEQVDLLLDNSIFTEELIGNNPRMTYYYRIEPQPVTVGIPIKINTFNVTIESIGVV